MDTITELKKNISDYLLPGSTNLKNNLTEKQLTGLKELLDQVKKLGVKAFANVMGKERNYECYLDEINRKLRVIKI